MIAADTSTWIAFFQGDPGSDVELLAEALRSRQLLMPPAVLTEVLSDPKLPRAASEALIAVPLMEPDLDYWRRAAVLRATTLAKRRKARLGDVLIAQSCLDAAAPLLARDRDFRAFAETAGLKLVRY